MRSPPQPRANARTVVSYGMSGKDEKEEDGTCPEAALYGGAGGVSRLQAHQPFTLHIDAPGQRSTPMFVPGIQPSTKRDRGSAVGGHVNWRQRASRRHRAA